MPIAAFSISRKAIWEIKRRLKGSGIDNPYVLLGESIDDLTLSLSDGFLEAVTSGKDRKEMTALARAEHERMRPTQKFCLTLLIYDFYKERPDDLIDIAGIRFATPPSTRGFLSGYQLDYSARRFVLRKEDQIFQNLQSIPRADAAT
jgi:hypothetical protein